MDAIASEPQLRNLIRNAPLILFALDQNGIFTLSEGKALATLGLEPGEAVGKSVFELYRDVPEILVNVRRALAGETHVSTLELNGVIFECWYTPLLDSRGQVTGVLGEAADITRHKQIECSLARRVEMERLLADISTRFIHLAPQDLDQEIVAALGVIGRFAAVDRSYVFLFSEDGTVMRNTHEWCAQGVEPQRDNLENLPADSFPWWVRKLRRFENILIPRVSDLPAEASSERATLEVQGIQSAVVVPLISGKRLSGFLGFDSVRSEKAWEEDDLALLETLANIFVSALEQARSEGQRRKLEEQLRQAQKMEAVGRLAGGIAHDFNNILTIIAGYSGLWLDRLEAGNPLREDLESIHLAAERAGALTRQLLAFSRQRTMQDSVIDLNRLILSLDGMLRRLIGEDVHLESSVASEPVLFRADPGQIEQVIMNLVLNARDAMGKGGKLTICSSNVELKEKRALLQHDAPPGAYARLVVSDTGCGMDAETQARIFEPFFTTKPPGRGTGFGLATVYAIINRFRGHISVSSEPGRGTTFRIYFPRAIQEPSTSPAAESSSQSLEGEETILVAEDEPEVRKLIGETLRPYGYHLLEAADGQEALRLAAETSGPIHLLLSDVVMPRMGGPELASCLRALQPQVRVLLISGYADLRLASGEAGGETDLLEKPFKPETLAHKVREVLDSVRH